MANIHNCDSGGDVTGYPLPTPESDQCKSHPFSSYIALLLSSPVTEVLLVWRSPINSACGKGWGGGGGLYILFVVV